MPQITVTLSNDDWVVISETIVKRMRRLKNYIQNVESLQNKLVSKELLKQAKQELSDLIEVEGRFNQQVFGC